MLVSAILPEAAHIYTYPRSLGPPSHPAVLPSTSSQSARLSPWCYPTASQSASKWLALAFHPAPQSSVPSTYSCIYLFTCICDKACCKIFFEKIQKTLCVPVWTLWATLRLSVPLLAADPSRGLPHRGSLWCFWQFLKGSCDSTRHISYFI